MVQDPNAIPVVHRDIATILESIDANLNRIASALEARTQTHPSSPRQETSRGVSPITVQIVKGYFSSEQRDLLEFSDVIVPDGEFVKAKSKDYLLPDTFAKIARIVKDHGGEYISAGKESHFRFPKKVN